jgi:hypothetical protein
MRNEREMRNDVRGAKGSFPKQKFRIWETGTSRARCTNLHIQREESQDHLPLGPRARSEFVPNTELPPLERCCQLCFPSRPWRNCWTRCSATARSRRPPPLGGMSPLPVRERTLPRSVQRPPGRDLNFHAIRSVPAGRDRGAGPGLAGLGAERGRSCGQAPGEQEPRRQVQGARASDAGRSRRRPGA